MPPKWHRHYTNCLVTGSTGKGKTAWLEDCQRDRVMLGQGFCSLIFDQNHYDRLLRYLAYLNPIQPVIRLNLSQCPAVIPTNFFAHPAMEPGAHSKTIAEAIAGAGHYRKNLQEMQNYSNVMSAVVRWCSDARKPIQKAAWLAFGRQSAIRQAASEVKNCRTADELESLAQIARYSDWAFRAGSTWNRTAPFHESLPLRRFTGCEGSIKLQELVSKNAIILVNLTPTRTFSYEAAYIYAALILSQFVFVDGHYYLDLDEAPFYVTYDVCRMLDLMCKKGLRVTLLCHDPRQFEDERIRVSLDINAKIRVLFGGMRHKERMAMVPDLWPSELAQLWEKYRLEHYQTVGFDEEDTEAHSSGPFGDSISTSSRLVPRIEKVVSHIAEWSYEEKLSQLAERLKLGRQEYIVETPAGVSPGRVEDLREFLISGQRVLDFNKRHPQGISPEEADEQLGETHATRQRNSRATRGLSSQH